MPDYITYTGVCPACSKAVTAFDPELGNKTQCLGCGKWYTIQRIFQDKKVVLFTLAPNSLDKRIDKSTQHAKIEEEVEPW